MNIGHGLPVSIEGHLVAEAYVEDIDGDIATIVIPATRVQMTMNRSIGGVANTGTTETLISNEGIREDASQPNASPAQLAVDNAPPANAEVVTAPPVQQPAANEPVVVSDGEGLRGKVLDSSALD